MGPSVGDDPGSHGRLRGESVVVIEIVLVVSSSSRAELPRCSSLEFVVLSTLLVEGVGGSRHQMPWRFRLVERQRGYIFLDSTKQQHQDDSSAARRTGSRKKELPAPKGTVFSMWKLVGCGRFLIRLSGSAYLDNQNTSKKIRHIS